jgi:pseudouridine-5'-phosphate glycosidase
VVALESTIIAHGLPYPDNLSVARELEATVRAAGAVPATVAVVEGRARIGLDEALLALLAEDGARFRKAGAADLAVHLGRGSSAATTVSSTAFLAARAGIQVFATGGIGGVHRGDAGDVSSDLTTLASTPIAVVSAGAKAILDLPRTLEALETLGVLVIGYRTDELPAFYTRSSGLRLEHRADDVTALAAMVAMRWQLGQGGVLVANPIPAEAELPRAEVDGWIESGLAAAAQEGITGKGLTPFLLAHLARVSAGAAVAANRALALHDAAVAGALAVALSTWDH